MDIVFTDKNLEKYANDERLAKRKLGTLRAKKLKARLDSIDIVSNLKETENLPGRFHPLKENRLGQWSADLDHPYRLIIRPTGGEVTINKNGIYMWEEVTAVEIIEITDTHE